MASQDGTKKQEGLSKEVSMVLQEESKQIKEALNKELELPIHIALYGQPGSGKSSLINKLVGKKVAETGVKTDTTLQAQVVEWKNEKNGENLVLVDLPGYGTSKFPPNKFFQAFNPRDYDLFLCVFDGKLHQADTNFFRELQSAGRKTLFVRNKVDALFDEDKTLDQLKNEIIEDVQTHVEAPVDVYFTSCRDNTGLAELEDAIIKHLEPAKQEKWARLAKAYTTQALERKREATKKMVYLYAGLSAANAINPIPGVDVAVDLGLLMEMFSEIRAGFGLDQATLKKASSWMSPALVDLANKLIRYATREGLIKLLERFAARETVEQVSKYIPFVGQVIAGMIGFGIARKAGMEYLNDCYEVAKEILERDLGQRKLLNGK